MQLQCLREHPGRRTGRESKDLDGPPCMFAGVAPIYYQSQACRTLSLFQDHAHELLPSWIIIGMPINLIKMCAAPVELCILARHTCMRICPSWLVSCCFCYTKTQEAAVDLMGWLHAALETLIALASQMCLQLVHVLLRRPASCDSAGNADRSLVHRSADSMMPFLPGSCLPSFCANSIPFLMESPK